MNSQCLPALGKLLRIFCLSWGLESSNLLSTLYALEKKVSSLLNIQVYSVMLTFHHHDICSRGERHSHLQCVPSPYIISIYCKHLLKKLSYLGMKLAITTPVRLSFTGQMVFCSSWSKYRMLFTS